MPHHGLQLSNGSSSATKARTPKSGSRVKAVVSQPGARSWAGVVKGLKPSSSMQEASMGKDFLKLAEVVLNTSAAAMEGARSSGVDPEPLRPGGLGSLPCRGRLAEMLSTYGWITPIDAIEHPDLHRHGGLIWFSFGDVRPGTSLVIGDELSFGLYADIDGLGAEDCHLFQGHCCNVSAPVSQGLASLRTSQHTPLSATAKIFQHTPLNGTATSFTPTMPHNQHSRPGVLADCFLLNTSQPLNGSGKGTSSTVESEIKSKTALQSQHGDVSFATRDTEDLRNTENLPPHQLGNPHSEGCLLASLLPPPGLPPPPGLENCTSLKIEG